MNEEKQTLVARIRRWVMFLVGMAIVYLSSSGPVLGIGFWLRETTGWDGFYAVMWVYYPLIALGHGNPIDAYIEWWVVDVFRTVGPG